MKKLYLIDGMSLVFRAYFGIKSGTNNNIKETNNNIKEFYSLNNEPTGAIFGFINILGQFLDYFVPENIAICFDCRDKTFRHHIYSGYKANRLAFPEDLVPQLENIKRFLDLIGIKRVEKAGYEADDIIGTYSKAASNRGTEVFCYTSDKDFYQLLDKNINIVKNNKDNKKFDIIKVDEVKSIFGVNSNEVVDFLSLIGDSADNIPGVKGIGIKTAIPLIEKYKTIENIYKNIEEIEQIRVKNLLLADKENAFLSKKLIIIDRNVDLELDLDNLIREEVNYLGLNDLFTELGFSRLRSKWIKTGNISNNESQFSIF